MARVCKESLFFIRKFLLNHLAHKIHIFCPFDFIDFNGAENVNFVCQMVLQVFSYKKQTLAKILKEYLSLTLIFIMSFTLVFIPCFAFIFIFSFAFLFVFCFAYIFISCIALLFVTGFAFLVLFTIVIYGLWEPLCFTFRGRVLWRGRILWGSYSASKEKDNALQKISF